MEKPRKCQVQWGRKKADFQQNVNASKEVRSPSTHPTLDVLWCRVHWMHVEFRFASWSAN